MAAWRAAGEPYQLATRCYGWPRPTGRAATATRAAAVQRGPAIAERLGAAPIAADAAALVRRARLDPRASARPAPRAGAAEPDELARLGLTGREREILRLVAAGQSNPEIARALFISPKTASVHVSNILAKLGVSGRVEAAAVAHRLGLAPSFPTESSH